MNLEIKVKKISHMRFDIKFYLDENLIHSEPELGWQMDDEFGDTWRKDPNSIAKEMLVFCIKADGFIEGELGIQALAHFVDQYDRIPTQKEWDKMKLQHSLKK